MGEDELDVNPLMFQDIDPFKSFQLIAVKNRGTTFVKWCLLGIKGFVLKCIF